MRFCPAHGVMYGREHPVEAEGERKKPADVKSKPRTPAGPLPLADAHAACQGVRDAGFEVHLPAFGPVAFTPMMARQAEQRARIAAAEERMRFEASTAQTRGIVEAALAEVA